MKVTQTSVVEKDEASPDVLARSLSQTIHRLARAAENADVALDWGNVKIETVSDPLHPTFLRIVVQARTL